jgi:DNA-binding IclR family transcriptional regulator
MPNPLTPVQQKILDHIVHTFICGAPTVDSLTAPGIAKALHMDEPAVRRVLTELVELGMISQRFNHVI